MNSGGSDNSSSSFISFGSKSPEARRLNRQPSSISIRKKTSIEIPNMGSQHAHGSGKVVLEVEPHPSDRSSLKNTLRSLWEMIGPFYMASTFMITWNFVVSIFVIYNAIVIPIRFGFRDLWFEGVKSHPTHVMFLVIDYLGDICFLLDIMINFRMAYMDHGIVHTDTKKIARHYLRSRFIWDALASLPLDFFSFDIATHALLRLPRLIRLNRVLDYFQIWELHTRHSHTVLFAKLLGSIFLYLHWECCFYMSISYKFGLGSSEWTPPADYVDRSFWSQYLWGFFWATKATTGLGGETPPADNDTERGYTMVTAILSQLIAGYIIGSIVNLISAMNETTEEFRTRMANINLYMKNKRLPGTLTEKVRNYYNHLWSRQGGIEDDSILSELPTRLRTEVSLHINGDIIAKVPFFKDCNPGFINSVVQLLRPEIYTPNDIIVSEGDIGSEMFFISQGEVEVVVREKVVGTLDEGNFFGEIAILFESKRTASIRAKTYCDLFVLRKADLDKVLKSFPEEKISITEMGEIRISKDSLRNHIGTEPLFRDVEPKDILQDLKEWFQPVTFENDGYIYQAEEESDSLFFLGLGTIEFVAEDNCVLKTLKAGVGSGFFFGYLDFFKNEPRSHSARAVGRCTVLVLDKSDYENAMNQASPGVRAAIEKICSIKQNSKQVLPELDEPSMARFAVAAQMDQTSRKKNDKEGDKKPKVLKKEGKKESSPNLLDLGDAKGPEMTLTR
eukprot:TRINITY_DN1959_c0_g1_i2.p1 TRINITY_DN1959_c0_g1~~TRINITY_DN1959_c0_g1_i2.p1  ORF type:complete len:732 (+),score=190.57 TRINITY_DN1959_c0_g1_i2:112-2307(+)